MEHSEKVSTFAAAFVAAQQKIENAAKDKTNPHFRSRYADLSAVMDACKDALNEQGISILQTPAPSDTGTLAIDTVLMHKSGEWVSGRTVIPLGKCDPQGYGSAMTYARRYSLAAMVGVCPEDDDGEAAHGRNGNGRQQSAPPRQQPAKRGEPDAAEQFSIHIDECFQTSGFMPDEAKAAIGSVLKKKKVSRLDQLSDADKKAFVDAILTGKLDTFKVNGAPVGAGK